MDENTFHVRLLYAMGHAGKFDRTELAEAVGKSRRLIDYWLAGRSEPSLADLSLIREYLGVDLDWLISGGDPQRISDERALRVLAERISDAAHLEARRMSEQMRARAGIPDPAVREAVERWRDFDARAATPGGEVAPEEKGGEVSSTETGEVSSEPHQER